MMKVIYVQAVNLPVMSCSQSGIDGNYLQSGGAVPVMDFWEKLHLI